MKFLFYVVVYQLGADFFTEYGKASRYQVQEVIGKGTYGVKINDVFEHVSDATRILREIKLLRLLKHLDIVKIRHTMLHSSRREFKDIYVVFELMESDLHQVIKANDDLTPEHHQIFLYQLLRGLKYIHTANVLHRDLKPKNILANSDRKSKICDFGLAQVSFNDAPSTIFWTYTSGVDIWSIRCIFAEMLLRKPLFPGKNFVHQLDLMTDLLGTPSSESITRVAKLSAKLLDGTAFVKKRYDELSFEFTIDGEQVIDGLDRGVKIMKKGEVSLKGTHSLSIEIRNFADKCLLLSTHATYS
ncbi:putative mitogen-activated protein kinase CMGC-MAPK family [Helianthus annuus]|nr:putative mitogen-activated protein kinase CMGC-MAPK family [Helianthus annuus]